MESVQRQTSKSKCPPTYVEDLAKEKRLGLKSSRSSPDTTTTTGDFLENYYLPCVKRDKNGQTDRSEKVGGGLPGLHLLTILMTTYKN
jgi:hypothetical protein